MADRKTGDSKNRTASSRAVNKNLSKNKKSSNTNNKKIVLSKKSIISIVVIAAVFVLIFCMVKRPVLNAWYEHKLSQPVQKGDAVIREGVTIMGYDVSGMTKEKAIKFISKKCPKPKTDNAVTILNSDGSKSWSYSFSDFDMEYDIESAVNDAVVFANPDLSKNWWRDFKILESGNTDFTVLKYSYPKIKQSIKDIAKEINIPVKNASVKRKDNGFVITKSKTGQEMSSGSLLKKVMNNFGNLKFGEEVTFEVKTVKPKYSVKDFSEINNLIGSYSSSYSGGDDDRIKNLKNACKKINGIIMYPDDVLSVNEKFMPFTEENGWRNAGTIVNGQIEDTLGGGMCQISSALYMAALEAEIEIVERFNHSIKVGYMPYAFDATLAGDYKDLKIKNDTDKPIYIEAYTTSSKVVVKLYGKEIHDKNRKVEFENKLVDTKEPGDPVKEYDPELYQGVEKISTTALEGKTYELYKKIYDGNKLVDTVKINTSVYSPRRQVIKVGTKTS